MSYVEGMTVHDADAHVMELPGTLEHYIEPAYREVLGALWRRAQKDTAWVEPARALQQDAEFRAAAPENLWLRKRPTVVYITHSIEEAVGLSDRILVMSPSPGEVIDDIQVDLPRPRPIVLGDAPEFAAYVDRIHRQFERMGVLHGITLPQADAA